MPNKQKFTDQQYIDLYYRNLNDRQIAEILNVHTSAITIRRYKLRLMPKRLQINSIPELNYRTMRNTNNRTNNKWQITNPEKRRIKERNWCNKNKNTLKYKARKLKKQANYSKTPKGIATQKRCNEKRKQKQQQIRLTAKTSKAENKQQTTKGTNKQRLTTLTMQHTIIKNSTTKTVLNPRRKPTTPKQFTSNIIITTTNRAFKTRIIPRPTRRTLNIRTIRNLNTNNHSYH
jgi:hypothetical protein